MSDGHYEGGMPIIHNRRCTCEQCCPPKVEEKKKEKEKEKEQYVQFVNLCESKSGKTLVWVVMSARGKATLGQVTWHGPWRKYVFSPDRTFWSCFEPNCLRAIADFVENKTKEHREKK